MIHALKSAGLAGGWVGGGGCVVGGGWIGWGASARIAEVGRWCVVGGLGSVVGAAVGGGSVAGGRG